MSNHVEKDERDLHWHPGEVSLWIGKFISEEALDQYLEFDYSGEDETVRPPFCDDFEIDYFDEDFREAYVLEEVSSRISVLLSGCSYDESLITQFQIQEELEEAMNTVILLFNYKYHSKIREVTHEDYYLKYIGNVRMNF